MLTAHESLLRLSSTCHLGAVVGKLLVLLLHFDLQLERTYIYLSLSFDCTVMDIDQEDEKQGFLDTVEGEIALFRSIMRARPVGIHRHFHVLTIRNAILRDTGQDVTIGEIWDKLKSCYDLDNLENIVRVSGLVVLLPRVDHS